MHTPTINPLTFFLISYASLAWLTACTGPVSSTRYVASEVSCGPIKIGDTLAIGDDLRLLSAPHQPLRAALEQAHLTVVGYMNMECSGCVSKLADWQRFADSISSHYRVSFLVIASGYSQGMIEHRIREADYRHPVYIDLHQDFFTRNQLTYDPACHVFLVDKYRIVKVVGNPVENRAYEVLYQQAIVQSKVK